MTDTEVLEIGAAALTMGAKLAAPFLITALVVGFTISLFQSITQIQEMTLTFVPKMIAVSVVVMVFGRWMINQMISFSHGMFDRIPTLLSG
ncbi:MAG: flagellar biosynthetic protein FliQ [Micrococcales bacterium]|nr:MAG: flagellar biosynthetic protein FliQ [Micrococcales bacterium]PIE27222.1 MAG: flagellar biosynthetic protein FliQ [Micrococcales bacterium]